MMKNFSYLLLGGYQTFTVDKSMIKKVFSLKKKKTNTRERAMSSFNDQMLDQKQEDLNHTLKSRSIFRNDYSKFRLE